MSIRWIGTIVAALTVTACATPVSSSSTDLVANAKARTVTTHVFDEPADLSLPPLPTAAKPRPTTLRHVARPPQPARNTEVRAIERPCTPLQIQLPDPCKGAT